MKQHIKKGLNELAKALPVRDTAIRGFSTVVGESRIYKGKTLRSGRVKESKYVKGCKPVNNLRTLKKAYNRGGIAEVDRVVDHLLKKG